MNLREVSHLFAYTEWANARIFESVDTLNEEQYTREIPSSFPSIRATLAHVVSVEWVWMRRWKGESPTVVPPWSSGAPREELRERLSNVERERVVYLASITDDALAMPISYRNIKGEPFTFPLERLFQHLVNHSTYHRGQLTTMLRQVGIAPPGTDLLLFPGR